MILVTQGHDKGKPCNLPTRALRLGTSERLLNPYAVPPFT